MFKSCLFSSWKSKILKFLEIKSYIQFQSFHKRCYTCAQCKGSISGARYSEHNGELYDNSKMIIFVSTIKIDFYSLDCYQRLFGPKGVGYGVGAGALSTEN
jgi:cysteine/glycine-rich protein